MGAAEWLTGVERGPAANERAAWLAARAGASLPCASHLRRKVHGCLGVARLLGVSGTGLGIQQLNQLVVLLREGSCECDSRIAVFGERIVR